MQRRDFVAQASVTLALAGIRLDRVRATKLQRVGINSSGFSAIG